MEIFLAANLRTTTIHGYDGKNPASLMPTVKYPLGYAALRLAANNWIPACAGMTSASRRPPCFALHQLAVDVALPLEFGRL
jgi:hypothetical protein